MVRMVLLRDEDQVGIAITVEVGGQHMFRIMRLCAERALLPGEVALPIIDIEPVCPHFDRDRRVQIAIAIHIHQRDVQRVEIFGNGHVRVSHIVKQQGWRCIILRLSRHGCGDQ